MGKMTYSNRYDSINRVVCAIGEFGCETATEISQHVNLSRQNILDVLKHAKTWGYVTEEKVLYRKGTDKCQPVYKSVWSATPYGLQHASRYKSAVDGYQARLKQKALL